MDGSRKALIGGGIVVIILGALVALWVSGQSARVNGPDATWDGSTEQGIDRGDEGLVRGPGARGRRGRRGRRGANAHGGAAGGARSDTGPDPSVDTGITREQLIDEMIHDVYQDTGLTDEARAKMEEALIRIRDDVDQHDPLPGQDEPGQDEPGQEGAQADGAVTP